MNKKKWLTTIITLLALISLAQAYTNCEETILSQSNCTLSTPYLKCDTPDYWIYTINGSEITHKNLSNYTDSPTYYLNLSLPTGGYIIRLCDNTTKQITVDDLRWRPDYKMISIIIAMAIVILFFAYLGHMAQGIVVKVFLYAVSLVELISIIFLLYANTQNLDMSGFLRLNFYLLITLAFGIGMVVLSFITFGMVNLRSKGEEDETKWSKPDKWLR